MPTTEIKMFGDIKTIDIHQGGSKGFEEYPEDVFFVRLQCAGNDVQFWFDRDDMVKLNDKLTEALILPPRLLDDSQ